MWGDFGGALAGCGAGDTEVIDLVAVVECGEESHVAASSSSSSASSSSTFPSLLPGKPGAGGRGEWEAERSEAKSREGEQRSARTRGGAGRPGVESWQGHGVTAGGGGGPRDLGGVGPRDPGGGGQRAAVRPPGPAESRRGLRGPAPPSGPRRRRSILFLLGGPSPGAQLPLLLLPGLPIPPPAGGRDGQSWKPHASLALAPADVYL